MLAHAEAFCAHRTTATYMSRRNFDIMVRSLGASCRSKRAFEAITFLRLVMPREELSLLSSTGADGRVILVLCCKESTIFICVIVISLRGWVHRFHSVTAAKD
mmetsp:Transcript_32464/g.85034  ORF Transcript_32464/g.85034 Transcript_32464/m.85034 type:complete len:103 (+) Transcript_32464:2578-2886(+)